MSSPHLTQCHLDPQLLRAAALVHHIHTIDHDRGLDLVHDHSHDHLADQSLLGQEDRARDRLVGHPIGAEELRTMRETGGEGVIVEAGVEVEVEAGAGAEADRGRRSEVVGEAIQMPLIIHLPPK